MVVVEVSLILCNWVCNIFSSSDHDQLRERPTDSPAYPLQVLVDELSLLAMLLTGAPSLLETLSWRKSE